MKGRAAVYVAGLALIAIGLRGILIDLDVAGWAVWFAGAAVLHDAVLVPVVLAVGLLAARLPARYRPIVRAALVTAGAVALVAMPVVLGYGRRADDPSRLPLPYGRNLLIVLAAIAVVAACAIAARLAADRRRTARKEGEKPH